MRRLTGVLLLAWAVTLASGIEALDGERSVSQYIRDRWLTESGFPGGAVHSIAQTSDGYLWIGAEKGLVRFDGLTFRLFDPGAGPAAGPAVLGVVGAPDGSLWARLQGVALVRFRHGVFSNLLPDVGPPESVVSTMMRGRDDSILLATLARGALSFRAGSFGAIASSKSMPTSSFVISMAETGTDEVWLGTRDAGLLRVQGELVTRYTEGLPDLKINCLLAGTSGDVWIGTDRGIARWNGTAITTAGIPRPLHDVGALTMIRDRESNIWIAAGARGLIRVSPGGVVQSAPELPGHVSAVFEDRDSNLWIGTDRGLERWRDPVFTTYASQQGLPSDAIGPIYADDAGRVWFGPSAGGLFWIREGVVSKVTSARLADDVVYSIHGGANEVWVGTQRSGVTRIRIKDDGIETTRLTQREGLVQNSVFAVRRARDGTLWAGTLSGGASLYKDGRFATYDRRNGLPSNTVTAILETTDGTLWFGTPNGLSRFSRGGRRIYVLSDGLPSNDVHALFEDRLGVVWIGTAQGIAIVEAGQLKRPAFVTGLNGPILGFAEDRRGSLWINAVDRVIRVNRERLLRGGFTSDDLREYGLADGLHSVESVKRHGTVAADPKGRIWFALTRGLSVTDPARAEARGLPALTHVEAMTADGDPIDVQAPVRISSSRRRIALTYAGLSLSVPERVRYRYRLDGFDSEWSAPVEERQAAYTNLGPGPYRFRVMASNSDGLWNGAEAVLPFEIEPRVWQTTWFQLSAVVAVGLAGWGLFRLRMRQVAHQLNLRFEERLAERTHIAQELHDTLLQGFVSASMQVHVAVDRMPDDSPVKPTLGRALDLMRKVIDEGRNAVRGLRSTASTPHGLEQAFMGVQQETGFSDASYRVIVEGHSRPLKPMVRDEVYRIGREALINAFRHSGSASVEIEIAYGKKGLSIFVRDDGRGVDPEVIQAGSEGHWGITGMRERAQRIGGTLKIRSRASAGTEVELRIPAHLAFERDASSQSTAHYAP